MFAAQSAIDPFQQMRFARSHRSMEEQRVEIGVGGIAKLMRSGQRHVVARPFDKIAQVGEPSAAATIGCAAADGADGFCSAAGCSPPLQIWSCAGDILIDLKPHPHGRPQHRLRGVAYCGTIFLLKPIGQKRTGHANRDFIVLNGQ